MSRAEGQDGLQPIDVLLGQGGEEVQRAHRERLRRDPSWAVEVAETVDLLERLRTVRTEPSGRLDLRLEQVRHLAWERTQRHRAWALERQILRGRVLRVASVAAAVFVALAVWNPLGRGSRTTSEHDGDVRVLASVREPEPVVEPVQLETSDPGEAQVAMLEESLPPVPAEEDPRFHEAWNKFESILPPDAFTGWLRAANDLALLQQEYRHRFSPQLRRRAIRASGGNPDVDDRVQDLASAVADGIAERLDSVQARVLETSLALRALLASGSTTRFGRHQAVVSRCAEWLAERVGAPEDSRLRLYGGELASALSALCDLAVWSGGETAELVREGTTRLAVETLTPVEHGRPSLLHWKTSAASLGDAGRLLQLAPAFGVHPTLAFRARQLAVAHLQERIDEAEAELPGLLAAQLYGFSDLVDRDFLDHRLSLWPANRLPDYVALHHVAWSQFPARPGWTRFQQELRGIAAAQTPKKPGDCAALLLCLAMNFAAPGMSEILFAD